MRSRHRTSPQLVASAGVLLALATGCTAEPGIAPPPIVAPPAPPVACMLDVEALGAATGVTWTLDPATASDTRCLYDAEPPETSSDSTGDDGSGADVTGGETAESDTADGESTDGRTEFLAVDIAAAGPDLEAVAELCEPGTSTPVGADGFVCRFQGGSVFAAQLRDEQLITVAASAVPEGTTGDELAAALADQLR